MLKTNPRPPIGPWLPLLSAPPSLVLMQMCPQPTPLLSWSLPATRLCRGGLPLPHGGPQTLESWQPGYQPSPRQQVRPSCLQIWVCDWSLAVGVPHLGMPSRGTQANTHYTLTAVLDGLCVLELKELMKQANSYITEDARGRLSELERAVGTIS